MSFPEALTYSSTTGESIVPGYYQVKHVQYYFNEKGNFVSQEYNSKPNNCKMNGNTHFSKPWKVYKGGYEKYEDTTKKDIERYEYLSKKYGELISEIEEWKSLKKKLEI